MPPRKRARSSPGSSSSSASDAAPLVELDGGEPQSPKLVDLWKSGNSFTDTAVTVEGKSFAAHKVVLVLGSSYFETLFNPPVMNPDRNSERILRPRLCQRCAAGPLSLPRCCETRRYII